MKIIAPLMMAVSVSGFAPQPQMRTTTAVSMGLFDFLQPKDKAPKESAGGMDDNVFGGKGAKITIRDDEDNAMWVDEDKSGKKKKGPFGN